MFMCQQCGQSFPKPTRVVTKTQVVNHRALVRDRKTKETRFVVVGRGPQIREERDLCENDAAKVLVVELAPEPEERVESTVEVDDSAVGAAASYAFDDDEAGVL